jgi:hypothetical protein
MPTMSNVHTIGQCGQDPWRGCPRLFFENDEYLYFQTIFPQG